MDFSELGALVAGWLFGTLSPGLVAAIARPKRKTQLLSAFATEMHELRYKLAVVAHRVRGKYGTFDQEILDLVKPIVLDYSGFESDERLAASYKRMLAYGEDMFVRAFQQTDKESVSILPVPYRLPILEAHMSELPLFNIKLQSLLLRIQAELALYNDQVALVRSLHDSTFVPLPPGNHDIIRGNLHAAVQNLGRRAEINIKVMNTVLSSSGKLLLAAR